MKRMNKFAYTVLAFLTLTIISSCDDDEQDLIVQEQQEEEQEPEQPMTDNSQSVVINEIKYLGEDTIEILNNGNDTVDLNDYWLCLGPGQYVQLSTLTPVSGSLELASGDYVVVNSTLPDAQGGLGLYNSDAFTNADALVDFVQWGAAGSARENIAVAANQWSAGDFIPLVANEESSIAYDGEGNGSTDWAETATVTFGAVNVVTEPETISLASFNVTITNVVNYLDAQIFNTPDGASEPGPVTVAGGAYSVDFQAVPGTKLNFATMQVVSNDWFYGPTGAGVALFENGIPVTGDITDQIYLWDSGTEEEDEATFTSEPGGAEAGEPDDDITVRMVTTDVTDMVKVTLAYDEPSRTFTLNIKNIQGAMATDPVILSPGIVVLHALANPLFDAGQPERQLGLAKIAVQGNPADLFEWFTEKGSTGAPLRLSSSYSVFSPGIVYAFGDASDPVFTQGEAAVAGSGLEELAEDGNNGVMFDYVTSQLNLPAAKSNEAAPIGPGESLTFSLNDVPEGYKLGFNTMFVFTNDWFLAYNNSGFPLWDENGSPKSGTEATLKTYLYDSGTEVDQTVGFGADQAPWQSGPNTGAADGNTAVRRVSEIEDVQFGKGLISSPAGVVGIEDPRGGYNVVKVTVTPN